MLDHTPQNSITALTPISQIVELKSESEWREAYPVLADLKPHYTLEACMAARKEWLDAGGVLVAIRHEGTLAAVGALLITKNIYRGTELCINALNTLPEFRSHGYGLAIIQYAEAFGRARGCDRLILHSGLKRERAHSFYEIKCGMDRCGYAFAKDLKDTLDTQPLNQPKI